MCEDSDSTDEILRLEPFDLHFGGQLADAKICFRLIGNRRGPLVAVLGGISAHRVVAGDAAAWWPQIVGAGLGVDTRQYCVLGMDYLGGRGDSSTPSGDSSTPPGDSSTPPGEGSPPTGARFPPISSYDQADALGRIVRHLGSSSLHAILGASYGGMVALCFAERYPAEVQRMVIVSAADKPQALSTAWRSVQRQIVREAIARGEGAAGLKLARALAMTTYRSSSEFSQRFDAAPTRSPRGFRFPIEDYLFARGDDYVQKYRAESFLALSESLDLHRMDATRIHTPTTLIAVREDQLVPLGDMRALSARLSGRRRLVEIGSIFGHDAFLKEDVALTPIISHALAEPAHE